MTATVEKVVYTVEEFAELLGISRSGVYRRIDDNTIHAVRVGRCLRIPHVELERLLAAPERAS